MAWMQSFWALDLTPEQQDRLDEIQEQARMRHWELSSQLWRAMGKLRSLYAAQNQDEAAIAKNRADLDGLRRKMSDSAVQARKRMEALLTNEQLNQLRSFSSPVPALAR